MFRRILPIAALICVSLAASNPADAMIRADRNCRSGEASITFDDGPHKVYTPRLLKVLRANDARATFFVTGKHVSKLPKLARQMIRDGHAVENHSWDHPEFTFRSSKDVTSQVARTSAAIVKATGVTPFFMRPPFGETDGRIKKLIARQHLTQELWTIDTNDWRGRSANGITKSALRGLRAHKSNVILMHDAVANSPGTIKAVPAIIKGLRKKGYCLVPLQAPPVDSTVSAHPIVVDEGAKASSTVRVSFSLNSPSYRAASFRIHSVDGTAKAGLDFVAVDRVITIKRGDKSASIKLTVFADPMPNANKRLSLVLDQPRSLKLGTKSVAVTISDNGTWDLQRSRLIAPP